MAKTTDIKRNTKNSIKLIIFDFLYTLYNPLSSQLFPNVLSTIKKLSKHYTLVIVSSTSDSQKRIDLIRRLKLSPYFKEIIIARKTPELFLKLCKKYQATPSETLVVGDNPTNEILVAKAIGAIPVLIATRHNNVYCKDIHVVFGVKQLSKLIKKFEISC